MISDRFEIIQLLCDRWPRCFARYQQRRKPIKIGIDKDILAVLAGTVSKRDLARALGVYVYNPTYLRRLKAGAARYDLDGRVAGHVTHEQAKRAGNKPAPKRKPVADNQPTMGELAARQLNRPSRPPQMSVQPPDMSRPFQAPYKSRGPRKPPQFVIVKGPVLGSWRDRSRPKGEIK